MDTPVEEQQMFQNVTLTIAAAENEITEPNSLSLEIINNVLLFYLPFVLFIIKKALYVDVIHIPVSIHIPWCHVFIICSDVHSNISCP